MENSKVKSHSQAHTRFNQFETISRIAPGNDIEAQDRIIENLTSTPIGKLLSMIGQLPEIRKGKVDSVRKQIDRGQYNLNDNFDAALDRIIEELLID